MTSSRAIFFGAIVLAMGATSVPAIAEVISLDTLLDEMVDRDALARAPSPPFTCKQSSSYDRDTVGADRPGWFANWDRSQFVRVDERDSRKEYVMHDADGPGAIVRIWGTWHGPGGGPFSNGTLRFYIDGSDEPAIEGPAADIISGGKLVGPPLSDSVSPRSEYARRGHNLYLPIPYAEHCTITYSTDVLVDRGAKKGEALYYQINYRTYPPETAVRSFSMDQLVAAKSKIAAVSARLKRREPSDPGPSDRREVQLGPRGDTHRNLSGPAAINKLSVKLSADDLAQALRSTVLEISFDGAQCVWCPVGDFFGSGYRIDPHQTWYTHVEEDGTLNAFWVMPFAESATVTLRNLGEQTVRVQTLAVNARPWEWDDRSMHFFSTWRQYTRVPTGPNKDMTGGGAFDVNYVTVKGVGRYVGDTLTLFNGTNAWWGEGDEKIFVDGETFPSHIGTGTEDYYGYAWCRPEKFTNPFHAQPCGLGNLKVGFSVNSRYRGLDSIPFEKSIRFDMELWHWRSTRMNYAPSTFWYARPGAVANVKPDPKTAALPVARKLEDVVEIFRMKGALEGETLRIVKRTGGKTEVQTSSDFNWSGNQQIWWIDGKPGDQLVLAFPVKTAGTYRVLAELTKAIDYGIVGVLVNESPAGAPIDLFAGNVKHERFDLGVFDLVEGENQISFRITGANADAIKRHMVGLDYLLLQPE